jgi:hypothetical protein
VSWYLGICALALFAGATFLLVARARLSLLGARTTGEVVAYTTRMRTSRGEREQHMPQVRFVGPGMREHTLVSRMSASPARWPVGTSVPVAFLERDPSRAEIATWGRLWTAPVVLYLFAAGVAFAAYTAA